MITGWVMSGSDVAGMIVCTPEPGMLNWIRFVVFGGGGFALESIMACRKVPVPAPGGGFTPPLSPVLVTVKVIAGVAVGVGVGVGVTSGESAEMSPAPVAAVCGPRGVLSHRFWPNTTSARKTPVRQSTKLIKRRRLKKADFEEEFFLI
jgi:hypothetical protein